MSSSALAVSYLPLCPLVQIAYCPLSLRDGLYDDSTKDEGHRHRRHLLHQCSFPGYHRDLLSCLQGSLSDLAIVSLPDFMGSIIQLTPNCSVAIAAANLFASGANYYFFRDFEQSDDTDLGRLDLTEEEIAAREKSTP